jgi:ABC-type transport system involved in multi-copper enzyme maturation permease subunit
MCVKILTIALTAWLGMLRKKDMYVLFILLGALLLMLVSLNVFGLGSVTGYVKDAGLLATWVFGWILAVTAGARELPQEETRGTIYQLLAKPINRFELIAGKWLGSWCVVALSTLCFYLLTYVVIIGMRGMVAFLPLLQGYLLHIAALAVVAAIAVLLSTRLNFDAAASLTFVLTGAAFLVVPRVPELIMHQGGAGRSALLALYHVLPHFEVFDMRRRIVHDYGPAGWGTFLTVLLYGLVLTGLFLLLAWLSYRGKRFSRGNRL